MNGSFYEQLGGVAGAFEQWGACERTVVACALARRVPWPGLRLLQRAVDEALRGAPAPDPERDQLANDEAEAHALLARATEDDDDEADCSLQQLLELLPLVRSDNVRVKEAYVAATPALVQRAVDGPRRSPLAPDLARQLLSYLLVHPALTQQDQRILTQWLRYLENHISGSRGSDSVWAQREPADNIWSGANPFRRTVGKNVEFRALLDADHGADLQESFSKNGRDVDLCGDAERLHFDATISQPKSQRSNSLTPPSGHFMSSSAENLADEPFVQKPRSFSLSSEHGLQLRPLVMYGTTGSETRLDELRSHDYAAQPEMCTVAHWLKTLRLHKYVWLFTNVSYEQMMAMDDKYLEKLGVTKGARHKILVSIRKLSERSALVAAARAELTGAGAAPARALARLRAALLGPMPPHSPLPREIVQVLHLASICLSECAGGGGAGPAAAAGGGDELEAPDPLSLHCWLVEKALHHSAFNQPELVEALKRLRHRLPPRQFYRHVGDLPHRHRPKPRWRITPHTFKPHQKRWSVGGGAPAVGPPVPRPKSHSYPPFPPPPAPPLAPDLADDYSSLDVLCLQMTEQAIN